MMNETMIAPLGTPTAERTSSRGRFTLVRPFLPKRCPLPPSVRVPVTSANRSLLRLLRRAELEAWNVRTG